MKDLTIKNLHVSTVEGKEILLGVSFSVRPGEIHAIMGPNGGGKSTLAQAMMGHPAYKITKGSIKINNEDIVSFTPDLRAKKGLFLGFQYPVEVPGVNFASFLRMSINECKKPDGKNVSPIAMRNKITAFSKELALKEDIASRSLNEGFSGGEKKKAEILQLALLRPDFAVLDEPDSGLDVDALRYISKTIMSLEKMPGLILITHYQRVLKFVKPDFVHIMIKGKIVKSGKADLAEKIEKEGYEKYLK